MSLAWFDLGDPGVSYVRSYLQSNQACGKRFGRLLLDRAPLADSIVRALAPEGREPAELLEFERGGMFPKREPDWRKKASGNLGKLLAADGDPPSALWTEDAFARPTDGWIANTPDRDVIFFCGDSVIRYENAPGEPDRVLDLCAGATWRPDVTIVAPPPPSLRPPPNRQAVAPESIAAVAAATTAIIIGAWDDEGLLFCECRHSR